MTTQLLTTELDAVNAMLAAIGEAPVNTLTQPGLTDATLAYSILQYVCRECQSVGWQFNNEEEVPLAIDPNGFVNLPSNTLRVSIADTMRSRYEVVQRGMRLYDKRNHTFVFTQTIKVDITYLLTFEDMPEAARRYVALRSARQFLDKTVGSSELHGFSEEDEMAALGVLKEFEGDTGDYDMLTGSYDVYRVIDRQSPLYNTIFTQ